MAREKVSVFTGETRREERAHRLKRTIPRGLWWEAMCPSVRVIIAHLRFLGGLGSNQLPVCVQFTVSFCRDSPPPAV